MKKTNSTLRLRQRLLATAISFALLPAAFAASYYVVVPVKGKTNPIVIELTPASLPAALVNTPYSYDLKQHLAVTGDPALNLDLSSWQTSSVLPPGLTLSAIGILSGTPTEQNSTGTTFNAQVGYKNKSATQVYTIVVSAPAFRGGRVGENAIFSAGAPPGTTFKEVVFASYGAPLGDYPNFAQGTCHAALSFNKVAEAFLGKTYGSIQASNHIFGDPCPGIFKSMAIVLKAY